MFVSKHHIIALVKCISRNVTLTLASLSLHAKTLLSYNTTPHFSSKLKTLQKHLGEIYVFMFLKWRCLLRKEAIVVVITGPLSACISEANLSQHPLASVSFKLLTTKLASLWYNMIKTADLPDLSYRRQHCLQSQSQSRPDLSASLHSP